MKMRNIFAAVLFLTMMFVGYDTISAQINAFPSYKEDFESGTGGGWTPSGQNPSWEYGYPSKEYLFNPASGDYCWVTGLYGQYSASELSYLTSPQLDFSCYTSDPIINFSLYYFTEAWPTGPYGYDFCWAEYSTDGGGSWQLLGSAGTGDQWYSSYYDYNMSTDRDAWGGDMDNYMAIGWITAQNTITGAAGKNNVRIRFVMSSDGSVQYDGMAVDDIVIYTDNPTLAVPALISPADAVINQPMRPTLSWGSVGCATGYDIQVATDISFTSPVINVANNTTTSYAPTTDLAAGTMHYWRTRARSATMLSNWSTARTFTTQFPPPPIPVLAAPANGSTAQPLSVTLSWLTSAGASSYQLQVAADPTFTTTLVNQTLTATSYSFAAPSNFSTYYWRVNASNAQGTSSWSTVWSFRTIIGTPTLLQPTSDVKGLTTPVTTSWSSVIGAIYYELQLSKDASFSTLSYSGNILGLSAVLPSLSKNTQYFWRARAAADAVERGNWSDVWNFSTIVGTPGLAKPFDASLDVSPQSITLLWNAVEGEATYRVQVAKDILFADIVVDLQNIDSLTIDIINKLQANTLYYWRVRATNPVNGVSSWSDPYTFTTIVGKVTGTMPANGKKGVPISVPLVWSYAGEGKTYQIQVATDAQFTNIVIADEKIGEITGVYGYNAGLKDFTTYYWRVRPLAQTNAFVPWSETMSFTTNIGAPILSSPANGAVNQPINSALSWKAPAGAVKYTVRIFEDNAAQPLVFEDDAAIGSTITPTGIKSETKYIWMVQAVDADGFASNWSATWKFATTTVFAAVPALEKPENNAASEPVNTTLTWKAAEYTQTYDVQVSSYSNFSSTIINLTGVSDTTLPLSGLSNGERYFWRVRAINTAGASAWSETWTFVVSPLTPAMVTLISPPNGADRQEQTPTLRWSEVAGVTSYQLQLAEDTSFSRIIMDKAGLSNTTTAYNTSGLQPGTSYAWRVRAVNTIGEGPWSDVWTFTTDEVSGVDEELAAVAMLDAVYPNPASHEVAVSFTLKQPTVASVAIVNSLGKTVATIANGEFGEGQHTLNWNVMQIPSGVYVVRLTVGNASVIHTLNVTK